MALAQRLSRTSSVLVVLILLWAPLMPSMSTDPSSDDDGPLGPGPTSSAGSFISDSDSMIKLYSLLKGPDEAMGFGSYVTNLRDADGDGLDDLFIGTTPGILEVPPDGIVEPYPYWTQAYFLPGREDWEYNQSQLDQVDNASATWSYHTQRWLGDVNGDGFADMVSNVDYYVYYREDEPGTDPTRPYYDSTVLLVRYGTEDGLPDEPDLVIDLKPDDLPENGWVSYNYGGVGDVNGDGFNDLFVYRHQIDIYDPDEPPPRDDDGRASGDDPSDRDDPDKPPEPYPEPYKYSIPGDFQLFYGSPEGLPSEPSWNASIPLDNNMRWYLSSLHCGDVNGDGYSDIIMASSTAPHISIHFGSAEGITVEPDQTVTFSTQWSYGWRLTAPVDINGDEYDDLVIDYGQTEGLFDYIQYIYVFPGSGSGIPSTPAWSDKLKSEVNARVVMTDVNGDGLDDVLIHSQKDISATGEYTGKVNVKLQIHFNTGERFPREPSWQNTIRNIPGTDYPSLSDGGDFDGDGLGDAAIGVPSPYYWRKDGQMGTDEGQIIILHGAGVMDMLKPLRLIGGPVLYADYKAYDFVVNINPTGLADMPYAASLTLDPDGVGSMMNWDSLIDSDNPFTSNDRHVKLLSSWDDAVWDSDNNTVWVHFRVLFDWTWPHEDLTDVEVRIHSLHNTTAPYIAKDLFRVENDLDFLGDLEASGEWQGALEDGDWVRAGEEVTVSGPVVVYEGTTDIYPPDDVGNVVLQDNDGRFAQSTLVSGEPVSISLAVEEATDAEENLTLSLQDLPENVTLVSHPRFHLGVDADAPTFTNVVPDPDDWHSSSFVMVSITADDTPTAGVDARTLEYQYSINDGLSYTAWSREGLETTSSGPTADGLVELELPDGQENLVRWRVKDLVGNGHSVSEAFRVKVDTVNVTYLDAFPDPEAWQKLLTVDCGVTIRDTDGAGIEAASVQFRVSHQNLSGYGEWQDWDEDGTGDAQELTVSAAIELSESPYNYVQWRAKDIAGNGYTTSRHYRVRVDATPIAFHSFSPLDEAQSSSQVEVWINVSDGILGSGVDLASVYYSYTTGGTTSEWATVGMKGTSHDARFSIVLTLEDGLDNTVTFQGSDVAGNGPTNSATFTIVVDTTGPSFSDISPASDEKQASEEVTVSISVSDAVIGLDLTAIQYRFSTEGEGGLTDEWHTVPATLSGSAYLATVSITLARGTENVVQFQAVDLLGNTAQSAIGSIWVNRLPTAAIRSPEAGALLREEDPVELNATGSVDPDGDALNYTWYAEYAAEPLGYGKILSTYIQPGTYNLTLVVRDDMGEEDTIEVQVSVEKFVPPKTSDGDSVWLIVLLLIVVAAGGAAGYTLYRRRQTFEEIE